MGVLQYVIFQENYYIYSQMFLLVDWQLNFATLSIKHNFRNILEYGFMDTFRQNFAEKV